MIIGKNGVGKSETLRRVAKAALSGSSSLSTEDGDRLQISRLLAFAPTTAEENVFPARPRKPSRIFYRRFSINRSKRRDDSLTDRIVQLVRSRERIRQIPRWDIFLRAMNSINEPSQVCLATSDRPARYLRVNALWGGGEQVTLTRLASIDGSKDPVRVIDGRPYRLSSGEFSFLKLATLASLYVENGSLLLFDEPETHLHPNFIGQMMAMMNRVLETTGSAAIIATHSAYFVREVFRHQVTVLRINQADRAVEVMTATLTTFGANIGAISFFVFGEDQPSRLAEQLRERLLERETDWEGLFEKYATELAPEFLTLLRSDLDSGRRNS